MEKVLRRAFRLNEKTRAGIWVVIVCFVIATMVIFFQLNGYVRKVVHADVERNMTNISELNADAIARELVSRQTLLESISDNLSEGKTYDVDALLEKMESYAENYNFYNMGILTLDGVLHTVSGEEIEVAGRSPYKEALGGEFVISESFSAVYGDAVSVNVLTTPVYRSGELAFILTGAYRSGDLAHALNLSALNGKGFSFIVNPVGHIVIRPERGEEHSQEWLELSQYIDENDSVAPHGAKHEDRGFTYDGEAYYAHFERLAINDWYLVTCARERDVFSGTGAIFQAVFLSLGVMWLQILFSLAILFVLYAKYREKTQKIVFYNKLTGKKNFEYMRLYFQQLAVAEKKQLALFTMDVDKFKEFNFINGSVQGDALLNYLVETFERELPGEELFHNTADQFAGFLRGESQQELEEKVLRLLDRFDRDLEAKLVLNFKVSIGICPLRPHDTLQVLYSDAVIAKNTVKGSHVSRYAFYDDGMRKKRLEYVSMETDFSEALRNGEFQVYYQPKYRIETGRIVGAEALVRWIKPSGEIISPGAFIPCFENSGQIVKLDEAVLELVCTQMKEMEQEGLDVHHVSINLSRVHLKYPGIAEKIAAVMQEKQVDPSRLVFEVTESALYEDNIPLTEIVSSIHALGCRVDMDDYGMGVSGPSSLANIAFDVIKLDKSFIDKIGDPKMESVIRSTINLAADLGMRLVAEGVEHEEQVEALREWGCQFAQGYYYSKPVPVEEYRELLCRDARME